MVDQYTFGEMNFTWLDGPKMNTDGGMIFGPVPRTLWSRYYPHNELNQIPSNLDPILLQYNGKNYLIDASIGIEKLSDKEKEHLGGVYDGDIKKSLQHLNLSPQDIDVIMMTHMHNDHAGGLTYYDGETLKSTYPNAVIYVNDIEWENVKNPNERAKNTYLKENWQPVEEQVQTFNDTFEVAPGITMEHTSGHTGGHSIIRFEQGGQTLMHMADILLTFVHSNPLWVGGVDDYPMDSVAAKQRLLREGFKNNYRFLFYHDPFYRVVEYTEDGKDIQYAKKNSKGSSIPMTDKQDKSPQVIGELEE